MKKAFIGLGFASLVLLPPAGFAASDANSGNFWHDVCSKTGDFATTACASYVRGTADGMKLQAALTMTQLPYCLPDGADVSQMIDVFKLHLANNPQVRHLPAGALVVRSFIQAFPCPK
jgi:hypothetical protein